jgi:hypothetical protein
VRRQFVRCGRGGKTEVAVLAKDLPVRKCIQADEFFSDQYMRKNPFGFRREVLVAPYKVHTAACGEQALAYLTEGNTFQAALAHCVGLKSDEFYVRAIFLKIRIPGFVNGVSHPGRGRSGFAFSLLNSNFRSFDFSRSTFNCSNLLE